MTTHMERVSCSAAFQLLALSLVARVVSLRIAAQIEAAVKTYRQLFLIITSLENHANSRIVIVSELNIRLQPQMDFIARVWQAITWTVVSLALHTQVKCPFVHIFHLH